MTNNITKSEFFCNKCLQHKHVKFLAYRFENNKKACCTDCQKLVQERSKPETSDTEVRVRNKKITPIASAYVAKRQEMEAIKDLLRLQRQYDYKLEDLV